MSEQMPSGLGSSDADELGGVGGFSLKNIITRMNITEAITACHRIL
jgi:hypothetical protein